MRVVAGDLSGISVEADFFHGGEIVIRFVVHGWFRWAAGTGRQDDGDAKTSQSAQGCAGGMYH